MCIYYYKRVLCILRLRFLSAISVSIFSLVALFTIFYLLYCLFPSTFFTFVFCFFNFIFVMYGCVYMVVFGIFFIFFFSSPFRLYFLSLWWKKHYLAVCVRGRLYGFLFFFHLVSLLLVDSSIDSSSLFLFALLRFFFLFFLFFSPFFLLFDIGICYSLIYKHFFS